MALAVYATDQSLLILGGYNTPTFVPEFAVEVEGKSLSLATHTATRGLGHSLYRASFKVLDQVRVPSGVALCGALGKKFLWLIRQHRFLTGSHGF